MQTKKKINFWRLLWNRRKYDSFYEMYNKLIPLEPAQQKLVVESIVRTFVQSAFILAILGAIIWIWHYLYPHSGTAMTIIMWGTPIAIGYLVVLGIISKKMLSDFKAYANRIDRLTKGGGLHDGFYDMFDLN